MIPFEFIAGETLISLKGQIGGSDQSAQFEALNISLEALSEFVDLPIQLGGGLNAIATLSGTPGNPTLSGEVIVDTPQVNQTPLQAVNSRFAYEDARLTFAGRVQGNSPEALTVEGDIPHALPFMTVQPDSEEISISLQMKDDALALANILLPYVGWGGGSAKIQLQVGGTLRNPFISGSASFDQATFYSDWIQESLTDLTGEIVLADNRIQANNLQGQFLEGQVLLQGQLPLFEDAADAAITAHPPLTLTLDQLNFQLGEGVIQSQINGQVIATGALEEPQITGEVRFKDARVFVTPRLINAINQILEDPIVQAVIEEPPELPGSLNNFAFSFDNPAEIESSPIFRIDLNGQVALDGPFDSPGELPFTSIRPMGTIYFLGRVDKYLYYGI